MVKASNTASGLENGLRIQFRKILDSKRNSRNFSKKEKAAMERVVQGDFTANTLKKIGGLSFGSGQQRSPLTALGGIAVGGEIAGGFGAIAAPVIGRISQGFAANRTKKAANIARALVAGVSPEIPKRLAPTLRRGAAVGAILSAGEQE